MSSREIDATLTSRHSAEVQSGERFAFGANWAAFLRTVGDARIDAAVASLRGALDVDSLDGRRFLDAGSGSGLFSLAAHRLGATVTSFDYDPQSVACTLELRRRFADDADDWKVLHGSVLDHDFLASLGTFDVVYSWGVLHHTGDMWGGIRNVLPMVAPGGALFIAIYNDQGVWSRRWRRIKRLYCSGPLGRITVTGVYVPYAALRSMLSDLVRLRPPWHSFREYRRSRGMSVWHDWRDWLGGYPFEVAKPEAIILPLQRAGFVLSHLNTQYGTVGCVEYVFRKPRDDESVPHQVGYNGIVEVRG